MNPTTPIRLSAILALALAAGGAVAQQQPLTAEEYKAQAEAALKAAQAEGAAKAQQPGSDGEQDAAAKKEAAGKAAAAQAAAAQAAALRGATQPGASTTQGPGGTTVTRQPGEGPGGLRVEGANGQPGGTGSLPPLAPDEVRIPQLADALELKTLVEYVAETLQINVVAFEALTGSVVLNAPVTVKKQDLLKLLNSLLEQQNFMIVKDDTGWYKVLPTNGVIFRPGEGELTTTRIIPTPTMKPSSLAQTINEQINVGSAPGAPTAGVRYSYLDDLGVIIATDSPRRLDAISALVEQMLRRQGELEWQRMELQFVAPAVAKQRLLELMGQSQQTGPIQILNPGQPGAQQFGGQANGNLSNIGDRLIADQSGNALYFRGYPDEGDRVRDLLSIIDKPNTLHYAKYYAGSGALQMAELAERLGLGHVEAVDASNVTTPTNQNTPQQFNFQVQGGNNRNGQPAIFSTGGQQQQTNVGGPVLIVDTVSNNIIYYGTDQQHTQLEGLISKFDTQLEKVEIVTYKLKNKPAVDVADVLNGIAFNQSSASGSELLPGNNFFNNLNRQFGNTSTGNTNTRSTGSRTGSTTFGGRNINQSRTNSQPRAQQLNQPNVGQQQQQGQGGTNNDPLSGPDVFILADQSNNQIIVKAPAKQQEEFARVIAKLDQRTPQVYIEVQIVAVTASDDFRLAFETQLQAGQAWLNTNWANNPLGSLTTTTGGVNPSTSGSFTSPKQVATGLNGVTAALIKSSYVPIVVNALKTNTNSRILANPHLLVDDNVEAEIVSLEEQPTSTTSQTNSSTINNFGGYEQAGTRLLVTPSISEGGYMRLMYEIELSNFVGQGTGGFPPPKQTRNVRSDSVTVPGDTTIIVGGITLDQKSETIAKIPLLGNIPLLGYLFRDTNLNNAQSRLYVFITPRIFRDTNFRDPILHTRGWRAEAGIAPDYPELKPCMIEMIGANLEPAPAEPSAPPKPKDDKKKKESLRLWPDPELGKQD